GLAAGGDHGDLHLPAPTADLHHQRDVVPGRHVLEDELPVGAAERGGERHARDAAALVARHAGRQGLDRGVGQVEGRAVERIRGPELRRGGGEDRAAHGGFAAGGARDLLLAEVVADLGGLAAGAAHVGGAAAAAGLPRGAVATLDGV